MKNNKNIKMDIEELKEKESNLINMLHYSTEHLSKLFQEQLDLAQRLTNEKKVNDDLRERLTKVQVSIEVKESYLKK